MQDEDERALLVMIEDCEQNETQLTQWEANFVDSVSVRLGEGKKLSQNQIDTLNDIWTKATQ